MDIRVNDTLWHIQFKKPTSSELRRSDGTISLGVTDNTTKTITIADNVSDYIDNISNVYRKDTAKEITIRVIANEVKVKLPNGEIKDISEI